MTDSRWAMLAAVFVARAGMGFQYQTVASMTASLRQDLGLSLNQVGILIGAYFVFGIFLALPGGVLTVKIGARRGALLGLLLMTLGGFIEGLVNSWHLQLAARTFAGMGGVLVNVMMAKLVTDWFAEDKLATAMGLFASSWTFGVAIALVTIPWLETAFGLHGVMHVSAIWAAAGLVLVAGFSRERPMLSSLPMTQDIWHQVKSFPLTGIILAGLVWGWFNAAFANIFSFGPSAMMEQGLSGASAGFLVSLVLWTSLVSVPLGGVLADRIATPTFLVALSPAIAAVFIATGFTGAPLVVTLLAIGLTMGLPAGSIMALPSEILRPEQRALGMGLFFSIFYLVMTLAPIGAAHFAAASGSAHAAYQAGAIWIIFGLISFIAFRSYAANINAMKPKPTG